MAPSPAHTHWLTVPDVKARFRLRSSTTLWMWVNEGLLPRPHHLRQRALWRAEEIAEAESRLISPPVEP